MKAMTNFWNSLTSNNRHADGHRAPYGPSFSNRRRVLGLPTLNSADRAGSEPLNSNSYQGGLSYDLTNPNHSTVSLTHDDSVHAPKNNFDKGEHVGVSKGGVQMQNFEGGAAPPPPVSDSWRRIEHWTQKHYPELCDQMCAPATETDVDELENELQLNLPGDVRESFFVHDGQERGGHPTGLFFGVAVLDCEEVVEEYNVWKKVAAQLAPSYQSSAASSRPSTSRMSQSTNRSQQTIAGTSGRMGRQGSRPEGAVQTVYSHPAWIPLAKDFMGNNIAIDTAPGVNGKWGQVIVFGRDCDVKYVIAKSWASFLASIADDLESGQWEICEEGGVGSGVPGELRFVGLSKDNNADGPGSFSYIDTLKARIRKTERHARGLTPGDANRRKNGKGVMSDDDNASSARASFSSTGRRDSPAPSKIANASTSALLSPPAETGLVLPTPDALNNTEDITSEKGEGHTDATLDKENTRPKDPTMIRTTEGIEPEMNEIDLGANENTQFTKQMTTK